MGSFNRKAPPKTELVRYERASASLPQVVGFSVMAVLTLAVFTGSFFILANKNHEISEVRSDIIRLEREKSENAKTISDRRICLEQLKDGKYILKQARRLGLRQPDSRQTVRTLQVVIDRRAGGQVIELKGVSTADNRQTNGQVAKK